jgi:hypothetical protein
MINIYKNVSSAIEKRDLTPIFFEMGKIFRLILDFQPIELALLNKKSQSLLLQDIDAVSKGHDIVL